MAHELTPEELNAYEYWLDQPLTRREYQSLFSSFDQKLSEAFLIRDRDLKKWAKSIVKAITRLSK